MVKVLCRTFKHPYRSRKIIDSPCRSQGSSDDGGRGDEIVGEGVVEVALELEDILDLLEFFFVSAHHRVLASVYLSCCACGRHILRGAFVMLHAGPRSTHWLSQQLQECCHTVQ